jgi:opacity protein-like surface antigen
MNPFSRMAVLGLALVASAAQAQDMKGFYVGAGYSALTIEANKDFTMPALMAHAGYQLTPNVAVEARLGTGAGDDSAKYNDGGVAIVEKWEVKNYFAALAKVSLPLGEYVSAYGFGGFNRLSVENSAVGSYMGYSASASVEASDTSLTYGVGASVNVTKQLSLNAEYQVMFDDVDSMGVSVSYKF